MSANPYSFYDTYSSSLYPCMQQGPPPPPPPYGAEVEKTMQPPIAAAATAAAPLAPAKPPASHTGEPMYTVKAVEYQGRKTNVLCQSFNGPCPLLALVNVLVLRREVVIRGPQISGSKLLEVVGNIAMKNPKVCQAQSQQKSSCW